MMMRVLNQYMLGDFVKNFLLTAVVLTFVMYVGAVVQAIDYMSRGISGLLIMKIFSLNIPFTLSFVIPMSVLTTVLLHFGRLSADGEITAMKASGVSLWQIASPILFITVLLSILCLYINAELSPNSHFARRQMLRDLGEEDPLALLEEGQFVQDFPGVRVYIGKKSGTHIEDIILYKFGEKGSEAEVFAHSGTIDFDRESRIMNINLQQVRMTEFDKDAPGDTTKSRTLSAESYPLVLDLNQMMSKSPIHKKPSDMNYGELLYAAQNTRRQFPDLLEKDVSRRRAKLAVEASQRLALSLSCFSFALIGIPLGIRSNRRESSIGIGIALVLLFLFYLFIIISDALVDRPEWRPDLLPWIPVLGCQLIGVILLNKQR
ncbi:MAG: LptF/LptG family permease [Verrucomicrobiota bacterium]|jgi:lipopolysaccharide export system permease protein|nr:LptF/LptG family permease [Verrucomicrobiota bacterium]